MQKEILAKNPAANVRVYAIWFSMLPTDGRSMWRWGGSTLTDPRVAHFWDGQKLAGHWFAEHENPEGANGIVWDAYYLYGPEAQWESKPAPLLSSGGTVRNKFDELNQKITPLLQLKPTEQRVSN